MPATPGTSTTKTINPAMGFVSSDTKDPFVGIEVGRTYVAPTPTTKGAQGTDKI